jgi:hypothetical protein
MYICVKVVPEEQMRFEVPSAVSMKIVVFWGMPPRISVNLYERLGGICHSSIQRMFAEYVSKTSETFYQIARRHIPQDSKIRTFDTFI